MALKAKKKFANSSCLASTIKAGEDGSKKRRPRASNGQRYRVSIKKVCGERLDLEPRFLDGSTHLYMRVCPSVRRMVRRMDGPSDGWMVRNLLFLTALYGKLS